MASPSRLGKGPTRVAQVGWAKDLHVAQVGGQQSLQSPEGPGQPKGRQTRPPNQEIYRGRGCIPKSNLEVTRKFTQEKEPPLYTHKNSMKRHSDVRLEGEENKRVGTS
jgi:hypothetical protein